MRLDKDKYKFKSQGYLEKSYLDKDGARHITFEFSLKDSIELAKLELMSRDLVNHIPVLLEIEVKQVNGKEEKKSRPTTNVCNSRTITRKNKRVF